MEPERVGREDIRGKKKRGRGQGEEMGMEVRGEENKQEKDI